MPRDNYRQIRATITEQSGGRFSLRVWVKPAQKPWHHTHVVLVRTWRMSDPPDSLPDVLALLAEQCAHAGETLRSPGD